MDQQAGCLLNNQYFVQEGKKYYFKSVFRNRGKPCLCFVEVKDHL